MRVSQSCLCLLLAGALSLAACSSEDKEASGPTPQPDTTVTEDTTPPADTTPPVEDTSSSADTSVGEDTTAPADTTPPVEADTTSSEDTSPREDTAPPVDTTPEPEPEVRFFVLGDTGEGNERQYRVAEQMRRKCASDGCDFAVLMGDNIYNSGVESILDNQWQTKFELPYANLTIPFYAVLGNHDNGGFLTQWIGDIFGGAGAEFVRGNHQVNYTQHSSKWRMPARSYDFTFAHAHLFGLDTNDMVWSLYSDEAKTRTLYQKDVFPDLIAQSTATWKIAMGHHPYISNGRHGDAGEYEGLEEDITDLVIPSGGWLGDLSGVVTGDGVKDALDTIVCGKVDLYLAGHDHNRQWLAQIPQCPGTTFVVSGAGSKLTAFKGSHRALFQNDTKAGFFYIHLKGRELNVEAIDEEGNVEWTYQMRK